MSGWAGLVATMGRATNQHGIFLFCSCFNFCDPRIALPHSNHLATLRLRPVGLFHQDMAGSICSRDVWATTCFGIIGDGKWLRVL